MQHTIRKAFAAIYFSMAGTALADNPIVQTNYTADPAPLVYNDTVFLYTGHDEDGSTYYTMNDWRVYASTDMVNWTDRGSPLSYKTFSWAKGDAWASQCIYRNGKFYWYVAVSNGSPTIGVAVSTSPTGPFQDALGKPLIQNSWDDIDPTVFIDDDGQAYLYWGHGRLYYVKLNKDMITYSGGIQKTDMTTAAFGTRTGTSELPTLFEEGPWFYRRGGLYYMLYAAGGIPEYVSYSTSTSPTGNWTYRGVIMPSQGKSFTNHPGVIEFKGRSFFFYHNGALPGGSGFTRSVSVDEFQYNADGSIPKFDMTTAGIKTPIQDLNPYVRVEAETMAFSEGVRTAQDPQRGQYVTKIHNGDYIKLRSVGFGTKGSDSIRVAVASASTGGSLEIRLDSKTGTLVGTLDIASTGGISTWKEVGYRVNNTTGTHDVFLIFKGAGSAELFNFDYWSFVGEIEPTVPQSAYKAVQLPGTLQMEDYDLGGQGFAYSDNDSENSGKQYRQDGVDIDTADQADAYALGWTAPGEWTEYTVDFTTADAMPFQARVASGLDGGKFHVEVDGIAATDTILVPNTGTWTSYQVITGNFAPQSIGTHVVRFVVDGAYFNVDWIAVGDNTTPLLSKWPTRRLEGKGVKSFDLIGRYVPSSNR